MLPASRQSSGADIHLGSSSEDEEYTSAQPTPAPDKPTLAPDQPDLASLPKVPAQVVSQYREGDMIVPKRAKIATASWRQAAMALKPKPSAVAPTPAAEGKLQDPAPMAIVAPPPPSEAEIPPVTASTSALPGPSTPPVVTVDTTTSASANLAPAPAASNIATATTESAATIDAAAATTTATTAAVTATTNNNNNDNSAVANVTGVTLCAAGNCKRSSARDHPRLGLPLCEPHWQSYITFCKIGAAISSRVVVRANRAAHRWPRECRVRCNLHRPSRAAVTRRRHTSPSLPTCRLAAR